MGTGNHGDKGGHQPLCVVLKATEAGGYISHHLPEILRLVDGSGLMLDLGRANGECHVILPPEYCAVRAQALADSLNRLADERGRLLLEVEVFNRPAQAVPRHGV